MATLKQIEANRRNALKSTGPSTPEGKAAVRLNALRHGLRAHTVVLPSENPEQFQQLCDDLEAEWQPQTRTEQLYVEQMAVSQWKLRRMEIGEISLLVQKFGAKKPDPAAGRSLASGGPPGALLHGNATGTRATSKVPARTTARPACGSGTGQHPT